MPSSFWQSILYNYDNMNKPKILFPTKGTPKKELLKSIKSNREKDVDWKNGRAFCLIYYPGEERANMIKEIYDEYYSDNALNPSATPSLTRLESEVISMCADLFNGSDEVRGNITSGGTESILLAIKTARDWAKKHRPDIKRPQVIIPASAHPAFVKAFHYFEMDFVPVPLKDYRADIHAMENAITSNTILMVGSAPSYPHGLMDPIKEIAGIAKKYHLLCHVDSCIGGFMLPFAKKLGYPIEDFDFSVDGVTSISADLHKYGYSAKGASIVLYSNSELRKYQFSVYTTWNGGIYGSPTIGGTRPGGCIAGAWAALKGIGEDGYLEMAKVTMDATKKIIDGVHAIDDLELIGNPDMSILAFKSSSIDVYQLADVLNKKGWHFERQQLPPSLHLTVNYIHGNVADDFVSDLKDALVEVKKFKFSKIGSKLQVGVVKSLKKVLPKGTIAKVQKSQSKSDDIHQENTAAMYGMMNVLTGTGDLDDIVLDFMDKINSIE